MLSFWLRLALRHPRIVALLFRRAVRLGFAAYRETFVTGRRVYETAMANALAGARAENLEHRSDVRLYNVHDRERCAGRPCPIHNRTDHPLRSFPQNYRADGGFMERLCRHGVGHPDPDCPIASPVHGCDGCCVRATLRAGDLAGPAGGPLPEAN